MVNHMLMICADLENLTDLQPQGGCDDPNFTYLFKVFFFKILPSRFHFVYSKFLLFRGGCLLEFSAYSRFVGISVAGFVCFTVIKFLFRM